MLKLLARFGRPYLGHILAVIALQLLTVGAILFLPALNAQIIDDGIAAGDTGVIWSLGGIMLAVAFAQLASAIASVWFAARSAMSIGRDLRAAIFRRVSRFSSYQMSQFGPATLITRATNDVQQLQMVTLMSLSMLVMAPIMAAGGVVMALREDAGLKLVGVGRGTHHRRHYGRRRTQNDAAVPSDAGSHRRRQPHTA